MTYERDEAMRQQEATEAMIRMRDPDRRAGGLHPDPLADRGEIERLREALSLTEANLISAITLQTSSGPVPIQWECEHCHEVWETKRNEPDAHAEGCFMREVIAALSTPPAAERGDEEC